MVNELQNTVNLNYIIGFTDGEGTFNLVKYPDGRVRPQFLLFNTNKIILENIKSTLSLNCPIFEVSRVSDFILKRKKCYRLQARSKEDIEKIIDLFDKYPPIIKLKDYQKFKICYHNWIDNQRKHLKVS